MTRHLPGAAKIALTLGLAMSLAQCGPKSALPPTMQASQPDATADPYSYDIKLSFSPEAAERMKALSKKITVSNAFYGDAIPAAKAKADSGNQLDMGMDNTDVDAVDQTLHVTGKPLTLTALPDVVDQKPSVLINVASGPGGANQLSCGVFQDRIAIAQQKPVDIHCEAVLADLVGKN